MTNEQKETMLTGIRDAAQLILDVQLIYASALPNGAITAKIDFHEIHKYLKQAHRAIGLTSDDVISASQMICD